MKSDNNILIVGCGLAGITLAWHLHQKDIPFTILDSGHNHSSSIAAGLINPIVFRRMAKSWRVDEFLPYAKTFYTDISSSFGSTYFNSIPIRRAFSHAQEFDLWVKKQDEEGYINYLHKHKNSEDYIINLNSKFGTGLVKGSGYVDTKAFLSDAIKWLKKIDAYRCEKFDFTECCEKTTRYKNKTYKSIIFCEGYNALDNPYFNYLPIQATKGETLTIQSTILTDKEIFNRKCFILPTNKNEFKVGATYVWNNVDHTITEEGKLELTNLIEQLTPAAYTIINQEAGIRPTVEDRRPLIGKHPEFNQFGIFNGLGTKGYLMAPLLAKEFVEHLVDGKNLNSEISIERYTKRYNRVNSLSLQ